jgi:hypothetical protein
MDKKKSLELVKLEVLGCLNEKDIESLKIIKESNDDFPWKELADYQNLVALIASSLELKYPASELKDKTAMKLYSIKDEIKAKIDAKKALEIPSKPVEERSDLEEKFEFEEKIEVEEKVFAEAEEGFHINAEEPLTPSQDESFRIVSNFKEKDESTDLIKETHSSTDVAVPKTAPEKDVIEKITRDYIKTHIESEIDLLNQSVKKNKVLSLIFFLITLILIGALYFIKQ